MFDALSEIWSRKLKVTYVERVDHFRFGFAGTGNMRGIMHDAAYEIFVRHISNDVQLFCRLQANDFCIENYTLYDSPSLLGRETIGRRDSCKHRVQFRHGMNGTGHGLLP